MWVSSPEGLTSLSSVWATRSLPNTSPVKSQGHQEGGVGWGQQECTNFVNCTMPSCTHPWAAVRKQRRGWESRQLHVSEIAGPARWLTGLGLALSKTQEESLFSLLSLPPFPHLLHSRPLPPPNTHTSHPDTCPGTCPALHLEAHLPAPQGSCDLSLILLPDLWLSISHQPPSGSTIHLSHTCWSNFIRSHINTSLNSTLDYHVLSPDVPPNEKAVSMKLETLSDPLCSSLRALQCWDHTRCFMNIQECAGLFTSSLNLLYGQPRTLSVHES